MVGRAKANPPPAALDVDNFFARERATPRQISPVHIPRIHEHISLYILQYGLIRRIRFPQRPQAGGHGASPARSRHAECAHACRGTLNLLPSSTFSYFSYFRTWKRPNLRPETQRTLLRTLRPQARHIAFQGRRRLLHKLHGEVHELLEHRLEAIRCTDTEGESAGWSVTDYVGRVEVMGIRSWIQEEHWAFEEDLCTYSRHICMYGRCKG
jgi:hypothetical protein